MRAQTARRPLYAAGLTVILAATLAACGVSANGGSAPSGGGSSVSAGGSAPSGGGSSATSASPLDAVRLAARTSSGIASFTGTISLRAVATPGGSSSGGTSFDASFAERLRPALLARVDVQSLGATSASLAGGLTEILTPGKFYLKWSFLTQQLHKTKPWIVIPLSSLSKTSGVDLTQLFSQASSRSPLTESQLLGGASAVRKVGTGTVGGVAVTKYTGKVSLDKGMKYLSASARSAVQKDFTAAGVSVATFTVWIDGRNIVRKSVISESGITETETITTTITSIDQPVNVSIPAASQTSDVTGSGL